MIELNNPRWYHKLIFIFTWTVILIGLFGIVPTISLLFVFLITRFVIQKHESIFIID